MRLTSPPIHHCLCEKVMRWSTNRFDDKSILFHYTFHLVHQLDNFRFDNSQRTLECLVASIVVVIVAVEQRHVGKRNRKRFIARDLTGLTFWSPCAARRANWRGWWRPIVVRQRSRAKWRTVVLKHDRIGDFSSLNDSHSLINFRRGCEDFAKFWFVD